MNNCPTCGAKYGDAHEPNCSRWLAQKQTYAEERAKQLRNEPGTRYDAGKPRHSLIPPAFITGLAQHFTAGARKYADRNWEKGFSYSRAYDSLQRHAQAWMDGEDTDVETGSHHMIAVAWNACVLFCYHIWGMSRFDDRPVRRASESEDFAAVDAAIDGPAVPIKGQIWFREDDVDLEDAEVIEVEDGYVHYAWVENDVGVCSLRLDHFLNTFRLKN